MNQHPIKTPETLPWIPPGQAKEKSSNRFVHKKGSIASRINEEVASKKHSQDRKDKKSVSSKKSVTSSYNSSLSDSGRGSQLTDSDRLELKDRIVEILEEDENSYGGEYSERKHGVSSRDSGIESPEELSKRSKNTIREAQRTFNISDDDSPHHRRHDQDEYRAVVRSPGSVIRNPGSVIRSPGSVIRNPGSVVRSPKLKSKISELLDQKGRPLKNNDYKENGHNGQFPLDVRALTPNTAEVRGYQAMRKELEDREGMDEGDDRDSLSSRNSIRYYDREDIQPTERYNIRDESGANERNFELDLNQSFISYNISPRYKHSQTKQGDAPEAWLVFPEGRGVQNGTRIPEHQTNSRISDYNRAKLSINDYPSPRRKVSVNDYPSPRRIQGRLSQQQDPFEKGVGAGRAFPVNFSSSIGSTIKTSFANLNTVRETPVETFRSEEEDDDTRQLVKQNRNRCPTWVWVVLVLFGILLFVGILIGIVVAAVTASGSSSSNLVLSVEPGPGDNGPCTDYVALTEKWRRITGKGPSITGDPYSCDKSFKEGWYRFDGEAGSVMADNRSPPSWEDCGTSRVGWLSGSHPDISSGTVNRTLCVTAFNGNCEVKMPNGKVRGCPDPRGGLFYVYYLLQPRISCNWGYCALGSPS